MDTTSPTKRRVLGALDPNAASPRTPQHLLGAKPANLKMEPAVASNRSPSRSQAQAQSLPSPPKGEVSPDLRKRPLQQMAPPRGEEDEQAEPAKKRPCFREDTEEDVAASQESPVSPLRHRSASPETSSVFDNSINDTSHATAITEPEEQQPGATAATFYAAAAAAVAASGPARRGTGSRLTREQARQKAETIRLRLGLAAYKVRTGQTDVPLEQLQVRPMVLPRNNSSTGGSLRHALPPTASFVRNQQQTSSQHGNDYRRALPSGISLSTFGSGSVGARRSSQDTERHQRQRTTPATSSPAKRTGQQQQSEQSDTILKSSPPVLPSAPVRTPEKEQDLPDGLPRYHPKSTTSEQHSASGGDSQNSNATTVAAEEDDDVLPDAASGLLSLARG